MVKVNSRACNGPTVFVVLRDTPAHSIHRADKLLEVACPLERLHSETSVDSAGIEGDSIGSGDFSSPLCLACDEIDFARAADKVPIMSQRKELVHAGHVLGQEWWR